jgi:hypothetical protein
MQKINHLLYYPIYTKNKEKKVIWVFQQRLAGHLLQNMKQ